MGLGEVSGCCLMRRSWLTKRYSTSSFHAARNRGLDWCIYDVACRLPNFAYRVQSEYANKLLYISTLALAKLSIISLLRVLTASDLHRNLGIGLTLFIALWGIVSVGVGALQCGADEPWRFIGSRSHCHSLVCICLVVALAIYRLIMHVGWLLARRRRDEYVDRSMFDLVPDPCHRNATDEHDKKDHHSRLLWRAITVRVVFAPIHSAIRPKLILS